MLHIAMYRSLISSRNNQFCLLERKSLLLSLSRLICSLSTQPSPRDCVIIARCFPPLTPRHSVICLQQSQQQPSYRLFSAKPTGAGTKINTKVNFSLSDTEEEDDDDNKPKKELDKTELPPPYNPFNKKPVIEEPEDPKDLPKIFHEMRAEGGLVNNAVKMFDALSKDGLTHEALELFSQIKDRGHMPDVVAHTAVLEAYADAGQSKEALKVFLRMLASGVAPNAYTYAVLIKGLAADGKLADAKKYVMEMMEKGMRPNAGTYTAVFEAFVREEKVEEAREFLLKMKQKRFVPDEKSVREALGNKRGPVVRSVIDILFD